MAIIIKTPGEVEAMKAAGRLSAMVLREVGAHCKPGVSTLELDEIAETFIREHGGVRERPLDVDHRQALVEVEARRVAKHEGVDRFGETAGPGLLFGVKGIVGKIVLRAHR